MASNKDPSWALESKPPAARLGGEDSMPSVWSVASIFTGRRTMQAILKGFTLAVDGGDWRR